MTKTSLLLAAVVAISLGAFASAQAVNKDNSDTLETEGAGLDATGVAATLDNDKK